MQNIILHVLHKDTRYVMCLMDQDVSGQMFSINAQIFMRLPTIYNLKFPERADPSTSHYLYPSTASFCLSLHNHHQEVCFRPYRDIFSLHTLPCLAQSKISGNFIHELLLLQVTKHASYLNLVRESKDLIQVCATVEANNSK